MHLSQVAGGRPDIRAVESGRESPAVARMMLGARLRRLREAQFLTREEAGHALRTSRAGIGWLERGHGGCAPRDVSDLLTIYGVTDERERAAVLGLAEAADARGWWRAYDDVVPDWLETYLGLEQAAAVIRCYEVQFVPGLLQTRDYARAVVALDHGDACEAQLRRRVELRIRRQQVLYGTRAPKLWAVIDEAALSRPVGTRATMRAQLRHLLAVCDLPRITVQIVPFRAGAHAAAGPVSLLRLPEPHLPDVAYLEQLLGAQYPDDPEDVEHYRRVSDRLVTTAAPATETRAILHRILSRT